MKSGEPLQFLKGSAYESWHRMRTYSAGTAMTDFHQFLIDQFYTSQTWRFEEFDLGLDQQIECYFGYE